MPKYDSQDEDEETRAFKDELMMKHIDINDDPAEDILRHLQDACDWIEKGLLSNSKIEEGSSLAPAGVLVHCTQGISRSGSVVIAYCKFGPIWTIGTKISSPAVGMIALATI